MPSFVLEQGTLSQPQHGWHLGPGDSCSGGGSLSCVSKILSGIPGLCPLDVSITHPPTATCDPEYPQIVPNVL